MNSHEARVGTLVGLLDGVKRTGKGRIGTIVRIAVILTTWRWTCGSRMEALRFTGTTNCEGWRAHYRRLRLLQAEEARRGTVVRVREEHWKSQFAGMRGKVQNLWGQSEYAAVEVLLEDGRSELFWLPDLADIAV